MPDTSLDLLAKELGAIAGRIERETNLRLAAAEANIARREAELNSRAVELEALFAVLERSVEEAIANIKHGVDGKDGADGKDGRDGIDGKDGIHGKDGAAGTNGRDGLEGKEGPQGVQGVAGAPGKLPVVRAWADRIHYESDVVAHDGATYQAQRDTGRSPPHEDWVCLSRAGRDGADGKSFTVCGTWNTDTQYDALSVVALNGGAFVSKRAEPGPCPGDGWQLIASQGKQGKPGEKGTAGSVGPRGATASVVRMAVDDEGLLQMENADGSVVECDLYPVLAQLSR